MLQLFKIEWLKIRSYRAFWVLFGAFLILYPTTFFIVAKKYTEEMSGKTAESAIISQVFGSPFFYPKIWHTASWFGGMFFIIIGMLFILLITNEVQYRTQRQNIIDGWSRMQFLLAKSTLLIFFVLTATLLVFASALLVGFIYTPKNSWYGPFEGIQYLWYFVLMAIEYLMVAFLIGILIKRTGLAIIVYFGFVFIVDNILWGLLTFRNSQIGYLLPLQITDTLVPFPFDAGGLNRRTLANSTLVIGAFAYFALFAFLISNYFKKADIKT